MTVLKNKYNNILSSYYRSQPHFSDSEERIPNSRKLIEQPFQELEAGLFENAKNTLTSFDFLMARTQIGSLEELLNDFRIALMKIPQELKSSELQSYYELYHANLYRLLRWDTIWPAYKTLLQFAISYHDSEIRRNAQDWLNKSKHRWIWPKSDSISDTYSDMLQKAIRSINMDKESQFVTDFKAGEILLFEKRTISRYDLNTLECKGYYNYPNNARIDRIEVKLNWTGDFIAICNNPYNSALIQLVDKHSLREIENQSLNKFRNLKISFNGDRIIGIADEGLGIWETRKGNFDFINIENISSMGALDINRDGTIAVIKINTQKKHLQLWDLEKRSILSTIDDVDNQLAVSIAMDAKGETCITGTNEGCIKLWDLKKSECRDLKTAHQGAVYVWINSNGSRAATYGKNDSIIKIWDLNTLSCLAVIDEGITYIEDFELSDNLEYIVLTEGSGLLKIISLFEYLNIQKKYSESSDYSFKYPTSISINKRQSAILIGCLDGSMQLLDIRRKKLLKETKSNLWKVNFENQFYKRIETDYGYTYASLTPNSKWGIARTQSYRNFTNIFGYQILLWNIRKNTHWFINSEDEISYYQILSNSKIAVGDRAGCLKVWDIERKKIILAVNTKDDRLPGNKRIIAISNIQNHKLAIVTDYEIALIDTGTGSTISTTRSRYGNFEQIKKVYLSPDLRYIMCLSFSKGISIWELIKEDSEKTQKPLEIKLEDYSHHNHHLRNDNSNIPYWRLFSPGSNNDISLLDSDLGLFLWTKKNTYCFIADRITQPFRIRNKVYYFNTSTSKASLNSISFKYGNSDTNLKNI